MDDSVKIFIYVAAVALSIFQGIYKSRKKKGRKFTVPPRKPITKPDTISPPIFVPIEEKVGKRSNQSLKEQLIASKTALGKNPYAESLEYRKKTSHRADKVLDVKVEKENRGVNLSQINWKEAIIHSEILKPRF